jgi:hypothetical protein
VAELTATWSATADPGLTDEVRDVLQGIVAREGARVATDG